MILDTTTKTVDLILDANKTTNECQITAAYADITPTTFTPGSNDLLSNGTTAVTVVAAPAASTQRSVKEITVYNNDTVQHTAYVRLNDAGTPRVVAAMILPPGTSASYPATGGGGATILAGNPTATAGPTAINGSASTFMRSDAAPAIQKASASQFGLVEVDGTTITAAAGVISAANITTGSWTPADASGAGLIFPAFEGKYVLLKGIWVIIYMSVTYPTTASALQAKISGLPFAAVNRSIGNQASFGLFGVAQVGAYVLQNTSTLVFNAFSGAATPNSSMSTATIEFSFGYPIL